MAEQDHKNELTRVQCPGLLGGHSFSKNRGQRVFNFSKPD